MQDYIHTLNVALQARQREIEQLKQDHAMYFAVGRLPGHLPGLIFQCVQRLHDSIKPDGH